MGSGIGLRDEKSNHHQQVKKTYSQLPELIRFLEFLVLEKKKTSSIFLFQHLHFLIEGIDCMKKSKVE